MKHFISLKEISSAVGLSLENMQAELRKDAGRIIKKYPFVHYEKSTEGNFRIDREHYEKWKQGIYVDPEGDAAAAQRILERLHRY